MAVFTARTALTATFIVSTWSAVLAAPAGAAAIPAMSAGPVVPRIPVGSELDDTAIVGGAPPGAKLIFELFAPGTCVATPSAPIYTATLTISGSGTYASTSATAANVTGSNIAHTSGTYDYVTVLKDSTGTVLAQTHCGDEQIVVVPAISNTPVVNPPHEPDCWDPNVFDEHGDGNHGNGNPGCANNGNGNPGNFNNGNDNRGDNNVGNNDGGNDGFGNDADDNWPL